MPRRRQSPIKEAPDAGEPRKRLAAGVLARRSLLMREIAALRKGNTSKFATNAEQLLTRWWSSANWVARGELLKTADWLIRLEKRRDFDARLKA